MSFYDGLLKPGTVAPEFTTKNQDEKEVSLSDYRGNKVVLYFYPEDDTPTCTKEACNFRDHHALLADRGFVVLGVSPDDAAKHRKFIAKYDLPFELLADTQKSIIDAYNVWGEKNMYGRKYMGLYRVTYVIDEEGKIEHVVKKPRSREATEQILKLYE